MEKKNKYGRIRVEKRGLDRRDFGFLRLSVESEIKIIGRDNWKIGTSVARTGKNV